MRSWRGIVVAIAVAGIGALTFAPAGAGMVIEKDVNLDEALRLASLLEARGLQVGLTRSTDTFVPLGDRTGQANAVGADLFVSVHNNGSTDRSVRGTEVYAQVGREDGVALGAHVLRELSAATGTEPRGVFQRRGRSGDYYFVLRNARMRALIIEGAYLSNPDEARAMATPEFRQRAADGMARGIMAGLGALPDHQAARAPEPRPSVDALRLDPPSELSASVQRPEVTLTWRTVSRATGYRVWRDGVLLGEVAGDPLGAPAEVSVSDRAVPPGRHRYEVRAIIHAAGVLLDESQSSATSVTIPFLVVVDAGHGGRDPGAVGRF